MLGDSRPSQQLPLLCTAKWQEEPMEEPEERTAAGKCLSPLTVQHLYKRSTSAYGLQQVHIYADDLCITTQQSDFQHVEQTLELALDEMSIYYSSNHLKPQPGKDTNLLLSSKEQRCHTQTRCDMEWFGAWPLPKPYLSRSHTGPHVEFQAARS